MYFLQNAATGVKMKIFQNDIEMDPLFEDCYPKEYLEFIANYLQTEDIEMSYDLFKGDPKYDDEEMWEVPTHFKPWLSSEKVVLYRDNKRDLSLGRLLFGTYKDKKVVIEQNASPLQIYWAK